MEGSVFTVSHINIEAEISDVADFAARIADLLPFEPTKILIIEESGIAAA